MQKAANRTKDTAEFENKEQTAPKTLEKFRTRSKALERDKRLGQQGANRSKGTEKRANPSTETGDFVSREQSARKELDSLPPQNDKSTRDTAVNRSKKKKRNEEKGVNRARTRLAEATVSENKNQTAGKRLLL